MLQCTVASNYLDLALDFISWFDIGIELAIDCAVGVHRV